MFKNVVWIINETGNVRKIYNILKTNLIFFDI